MKQIILHLLFIGFPLMTYSQDWFDDTRGDGASVIKRSDGKTLFSTRLNTKDGIALNLFNWNNNEKIAYRVPKKINEPSMVMLWFKNYKGLEDSLKNVWGNDAYTNAATNSRKYRGWGITIKTKADEGIGSLISSGQFADGFNSSIYYAGEHVLSGEERELIGKNKETDSFRFWAFNIGLNGNSFRFYRPEENIKKQLSDFEFTTGYQASYSYFTLGENKSGSNVIKGISLTYRLKNNYSKLPKVNVKDIRSNVTIGKDSLRSVEYIDNDGSNYALNDKDHVFKKYSEILLRGQIGIIPKDLAGRVCFLFYPEAAYSNEKVSFNVGFGLQLLKDKQPLISDAGVFLKFSDIFNSSSSTDPFFKRSVELGVTASLNILTGEGK